MSRENTATAADNDDTSKIAELIIDSDTAATKEADILIDEEDPKACLNCGYQMIELKTCMLQCPNCGSVKDCSEKGIW
jgi:Zn finger protein HypA/HybF involved in hydrogenase expression